MAFPASNAQADVTKKILEDIQIKKQLLQKGVSPVTSNINTSTPAGLTIPQYIQANSQSGQSSDSTINATTKAVWTQALNQSHGFFIPQDSLFGNSIIPVLPRFDNSPAGSSSAATGSQSSAGGGNK